MKTIRFVLFFALLSAGSVLGQTNSEIPNIFTPNNDGVNDIFRISTSGYTEMTCTIFNRHGETVYRFYGLNGSWDAFSHAGVKVTAGTYFVLVELTTADGTVETKQSTLQVQY